MSYLGSKVLIPGDSGYGIIRYHGPIRNKNGTFVGLELLGSSIQSRGKNSGSVDGVQYFQVEIPKSGLFLPFDRLLSANPQLEKGTENFQERKPLSSYSNARINMLNENVVKSEDTKDIEINELKRVIKEKDKKLESFNVQRQEWRAAMDELVNVQTEGMNIFEEKINELELEIARLAKLNQEKDDKLKHFEETYLNEKMININLEEKRPHNPQSDCEEEKALPIYTPPTFDPSSGKTDWCGLCERDGHSSINCPYENEIY